MKELDMSRLFVAMHYQSLLLEEIVAQLRAIRGLGAEDLEFCRSGRMDCPASLEGMQNLRRSIYFEDPA